MREKRPSNEHSPIRGVARLALLLALLAPAIALADFARLLQEDEQAAMARLALFDRVEREFNGAYFEFAADTTGLSYLAQLRDLAVDGKVVRQIIDHSYNEIPPKLMAYLEQKGVQIRTYGQFDWKEPYRSTTRRLHDKLMIADGQRVINGSRNTKNAYYTNRKIEDTRFHDVDAYFEGDGVRGAQDYFLERWKSPNVKRPRLPTLTPEEFRQQERIMDRYSALAKSYRRKHAVALERILAPESLVEVENLRFYHDPVKLKGSAPGSERSWLDPIAEARQRIVIENPYIVLTDEMGGELTRAAARGVDTNLLTSAIGANNVRLVEARYASERIDFSRKGLKFWEYDALKSYRGKTVTQRNWKRKSWRTSIHTKTLVVDGKKVVVGSFNLDPRSSNLNSEVAFAFDSPELARELEERFERQKARSTLFVKGTSPEPTGCMAGVLRVVSKLIRPQL